MLELIVNIVLLAFFGYTLGFHVLEAAVPAKVQRNPYALQPGIWPSVILVLLIICVAFNIVRIIRKNKGNPDFNFKHFLSTVPGFFKSKLFLGILIVVVLSFILEPLGFMPACFIFLVAYGILLGERRYLRLALFALVITLVLYICFGVLLQVNLPRGTIPFLRNFSLFVERLIR